METKLNDDGRDKLDPHDRALEIAIVQHLMKYPDDMGYAKTKIRRSQWFYTLDQQYIWKAMLRLHDKGQEVTHPMVARELLADRKEYDHIMKKWIDPVTLPKETRQKVNVAVDEDNNDNDILIQSMSNQLMLSVLLVPDMWIALETMLKTLTDLAYRRQQIWNAGQDAKDAHTASLSVKDLHDRSLDRRKGMIPSADNKRMIKELAGGYIDRLVDAMRNNTTVQGYPTGSWYLDQMLGTAYRAGTFTGFAGFFNSYKSFLIMQMALAAAKSGLPVVFNTLETDPATAFERMLAIESGVPLTAIQTLAVRNDEDGDLATRVMATAGEFEALPIEIVQISNVHDLEPYLTEASLRHWKEGVCFIDDVDTLSKMSYPGKIYDQLQQTIPHLLPLAAMTGWAIVATKQLLPPKWSGGSNDQAYNTFTPNASSIEGGSTFIQKVGNLVVMDSGDWIREKMKPDFKHDDLPAGKIRFRLLRARDKNGVDANSCYLNIDRTIPRYTDPKEVYIPADQFGDS